MAEITKNTKIQLANGNLTSWTEGSAKDRNLLRGEIAIAYTGDGTAEVRIGSKDGDKAYADAVKLQISADQVIGLGDKTKDLSDKIDAEIARATGVETTISSELTAEVSRAEAAETALQTNIDAKSSVYIGKGTEEAKLSDLKVQKVTPAEYAAALAAEGGIPTSALYVVESDDGHLDAFGQRIQNVADGTLSDDAATFGQLSSLSAAHDARLTTIETTYETHAEHETFVNDTGLSAASKDNMVVTKNDIKDLAGAMHFRGVVTKNEGETDAQAIARVITDPAAGDIVLVGTKEYVYGGDPAAWHELGDEAIYLTTAAFDTWKSGTYDVKMAAVDLSAETLSENLASEAATRAADDTTISNALTSHIDAYSTWKAGVELSASDISAAVDTELASLKTELEGEVAAEVTRAEGAEEYLSGVVDDLSAYTYGLSASQLAWDIDIICGGAID